MGDYKEYYDKPVTSVIIVSFEGIVCSSTTPVETNGRPIFYGFNDTEQW